MIQAKSEALKKRSKSDLEGDHVMSLLKQSGKNRISAAANSFRGRSEFQRPSIYVPKDSQNLSKGGDWVNVKHSTLSRLVKSGHLKKPRREVSGISWDANK